tara:strand:- start:27159 stop:28310 length:1152 start_codon:yes stop_codon:yes gene_type:complete
MAIGEDNILDGLDLSVLDNLTTNPEKKEDQVKAEGEETKTEDDPGIFNPELKIQEVDELPDNTKQEPVEEEKNEPEGEVVEEDKEEPVSEAGTEGEVEEENSEPALKVFAQIQRDSGLIDFNDDDFEDSEEWLISKVQETINTKVEEYKESMPEEIKYLLENHEAGVNIYDLLQSDSKQQTYDSIDKDKLGDSESMQRKLVKDLLAINGFSQAQIDKKVARYEDAGVLLEEAEEALSTLQDVQKQHKEQMIQQQKQEKEQRIEAHKNWLSDLKTHITKKEEILPGFKLNPKDKDLLYNGITKLDRNGKNEIMRMREKDPEFDLKIAYLATVLKWDFSAFERQSTTKSTRKLADAIKSTKKTGSRPSRGTSNTVNFDTMRKSLR